MSENRNWVAATVFWLFLLFNIERIYEPINLASFVYVLSTLVGVTLIVCRPLRRLRFATVAAAMLGIFITSKCLLGYPIVRQTLILTLLEAACTIQTAYLCFRIGISMDEFAQSSKQMILASRTADVPDMRQAEPEMQRELGRARRYERPLTFLTIKPVLQEQSVANSQLLEQLRAEFWQHYLSGCIADTLLTQTKSDDLVARTDDGFVMVLPETDRVQAQGLIDRLKKLIGNRYQLSLECGTAAFPEDEITLLGLIETATNRQRLAQSRILPDADSDEHSQPTPSKSDMLINV